MSEEKKKEKFKPDMETAEFTPKKDHKVSCPPHYEKQLKKGIKAKIPKFIQSSLKSEGAI